MNEDVVNADLEGEQAFKLLAVLVYANYFTVNGAFYGNHSDGIKE